MIAEDSMATIPHFESQTAYPSLNGSAYVASSSDEFLAVGISESQLAQALRRQAPTSQFTITDNKDQSLDRSGWYSLSGESIDTASAVKLGESGALVVKGPGIVKVLDELIALYSKFRHTVTIAVFIDWK